MSSQSSKWREEQILILCPGSRTTMAQLGCHELTPPAYRIPTRMFRDEETDEWRPYRTWKRRKTTVTSEVDDEAGDGDDGWEYVEDPDSDEGAVYPMEGGYIVNMEAFLAFLEHVHGLLTTTYHNTPIVLMASPQWTRPDCEAIALYIFEKTRTPALCMINSALATQYGLKWPHMTVVDIGFEKVDVTCIYDSRIVSHMDVGHPSEPGEVRAISGGEVFTQRLKELLREKGFTYEMAEQLKKSPICEVLPYAPEEPQLMELPEDEPGAAPVVAATAAVAVEAAQVVGPSQAAAVEADADLAMEDGIAAADSDGVLDVAAIVTTGQTKEFLAKKEKEKTERGRFGRRAKEKEAEAAAKPLRLPNAKRARTIFHFEELVEDDGPQQTSLQGNGTAAGAGAGAGVGAGAGAGVGAGGSGSGSGGNSGTAGTEAASANGKGRDEDAEQSEEGSDAEGSEMDEDEDEDGDGEGDEGDAATDAKAEKGDEGEAAKQEAKANELGKEASEAAGEVATKNEADAAPARAEDGTETANGSATAASAPPAAELPGKATSSAEKAEAEAPAASEDATMADEPATSQAEPKEVPAAADDADKPAAQKTASAAPAAPATAPATATATATVTAATTAVAAAAAEQQGRRFKRLRRDFEIGLERFTFADRTEIDRIVATIYRTVQGIQDMYMRPSCWENLVFVGNGCRLRGLRENILQTLQGRHLISPSTATIFTSELPSNLGTPTGTGAQTPTGSFSTPPHQLLQPPPSSVNPLLQAATTAASLGLPGGPGSAVGAVVGAVDGSGHSHHFHSQTPTAIKTATLPTYLGEWTKNGFEEAMFLGAQVAGRLAFCVHNLDAQGLESQRLMYLSRIDYNELGPKGIRTHSLLG